MDCDNIMIMRLQDNLNTIRKLAGWTAQELGDKIGVTKQTISNLENKKSNMTKLQYIGIRSVLDHEANSSSENAPLLKVALAKLLDEELSKEELDEYELKMETAAAALSGGASASNISIIFNSSKESSERQALSSIPKAITKTMGYSVGSAIGLTVPGPVGVIAGTIAGVNWLDKLLGDDEK